MTVAALTDTLRERYGLEPDARGLVVTRLEDGSDAYDKGMREGDVITEVGQEAVGSPQEMQARIEAAEAGGAQLDPAAGPPRRGAALRGAEPGRLSGPSGPDLRFGSAGWRIWKPYGTRMERGHTI